MRAFIFLSIFNLIFAQLAWAERIGFDKDIGHGWGKGKVWLKSLERGFKPHGVTIVDQKDGHPVRLGSKSILFEVRGGDCGRDAAKGGWNDCKKDRERHELSHIGKRHKHGDEYYVAYSLFVPEKNQHIVPSNTSMGQFHQKKNNVLWITNWTNSGYVISSNYPNKDETRHVRTLIPFDEFKGKWHDILIHSKWSHNKNGFFNIYLNGEHVYQFKGQTLAKGDQSYFKFGIYRSYISRYEKKVGKGNLPTQTAYYDAVNRGKQLHKVDQAGVARLQEILKSKGHYDGVVDGLWGRNTLKGTNALLAEIGEDPIEKYNLDLWDILLYLD